MKNSFKEIIKSGEFWLGFSVSAIVFFTIMFIFTMIAYACGMVG